MRRHVVPFSLEVYHIIMERSTIPFENQIVEADTNDS